MSSPHKKSVSFDLDRDLHEQMMTLAGDGVPKSTAVTALVKVALRRPAECGAEIAKLHAERDADLKAHRKRWIGSSAR